MKKLITKRRIYCLAVILAIVIVPFLYSYFYLGAFWDPYSKLETLPVAVVNSDQGAVINGTERNLGQELCDRLKEDGSLKFIFTDAKDANEGTQGTKYYAMIEIPGDFSEKIASADTREKQTATITYSPNEKHNFLASQILNRAVLEIEEQTRSSVNEEIVQTLADKLKEVPDQLTELQDGLGKLSNGSSDLLEGVGTLANGTNSLLDGTATLADGTTDLLAGSKSLANGTGTLLDGTKVLLSGSADLAAGSKTFYSKFGDYKQGVDTLTGGTKTLADGAAALKTGIDQVKAGSAQLVEKTESIGQLSTGAQTIAEGTKTLDTSLTQYTQGVDQLISMVDSTSSFLAQYVKANPDLLKDPTFAAFIAKLSDPTAAQSLKTLQAAGPQLTTASARLAAGSEQLYEGTTGLSELNTALASLDAGIGQLQEGAGSLSEGADTLEEGASDLSTATGQLYTAAGDISAATAQLNAGAADLSSGAKDLDSGANKLNSGVQDLNSGAQNLKDGAGDLKDGADQLLSGTGELNDGINSAKDGVDTALTDANSQLGNLDGIAEYASEPVSVEQENVTSIANYGTAFAPYFMSLSLWVGALILFVGIYLDTEGKFKILSRESNHKLARSFMFLIIGFAQAIALALVVQFGLGLEVDNVFLFYASVCLVSMVFIAIVQFLMVHLKSVGKLLSVVLLILQLTSCGGTFPMETVPKLFNVLYPYMPMTYSVALFKQAITDTDTKAVLYNGGVLLAILIVFMALTILLSAIKGRRAEKAKVQMPVQFE